MRAAAIIAGVISSLLLAIPCGALSQDRDRVEVPEEFSWDLSHLFESDAQWDSAIQRTEGLVRAIGECEGTMGRSPARFLTCLERRAEILKELRRLSEYAFARQLEGTQDPHTRAINDELTRLTQYTNAATGFFEAEILAIDETVLSDFLEAEPGLRSYGFYLHDLNRRRTRTLSRPEERLISEAQMMAAAPRSIYLTLIDELRYPAVELSTAEMFQLDPQGFRRRRAALPSSEDRDLVTEHFSEVSEGYASVLGALLNARMTVDLFQTRARQYDVWW